MLYGGWNILSKTTTVLAEYNELITHILVSTCILAHVQKETFAVMNVLFTAFLREHIFFRSHLIGLLKVGGLRMLRRLIDIMILLVESVKKKKRHFLFPQISSIISAQ